MTPHRAGLPPVRRTLVALFGNEAVFAYQGYERGRGVEGDGSPTQVQVSSTSISGTGRVQTSVEGRVSPDVVKLSAKIRQIVVVGDTLLGPVDFHQLDPFVPCDLGLRRGQVERGVPCAAVRAVEPASEWMGVGEGGVDDVVVGNAGNQLVNADARKPVGLGREAFIGGEVQLEDSAKVVVTVRDPDEDTVPAIAVFRGDQPMRVELPYPRNGGKLQRPPRRASRSLRTVANAGNPPLTRYSCGVMPPKILRVARLSLLFYRLGGEYTS